MAIQAIMQKRLVVTTPGETVAVAAKRMSDHLLGALLVVEGKKLVGIFSERDLLVRVVAAGKDPAATLVGEVATRDPVTVAETAEIQDCYRIIKERGFRHLPVVAADGSPVGVISSRDFLQVMVLGLAEQVDLGKFFHQIGKLVMDTRGA
jgi:CBS domain-containing protein